MLRFSFPDRAIFSATTYKTSSTLLPLLPEITPHPVIHMNQTHGAQYAIITEPTTQTILETDAIITTLPDLTLAVKTADCLPILLWHQSGIIGALHAGRVGTRQHLLKKVLRMLQHDFAVTDGIHLIFGPAICADCYTIAQNPDEHFDLVAENLQQAHQIYHQDKIEIHLSGRCTAHEPEHFHSYRRDGKGVPMNYSVICRKQR